MSGLPPAFEDELGLGLNLRADLDPPAHVYADEGLVVVRIGGAWPLRCVACNAAVPAGLRRVALRWYPVEAFVFTGWWALLTRTVVVLRVGRCPEHERRRSRVALAGWAMLVGAPAVLGGVGFAVNDGVAVIAGALGGLAGLAVLAWSDTPLRVVRVEDDVCWVKAGAPFVASLPVE